MGFESRSRKSFVEIMWIELLEYLSRPAQKILPLLSFGLFMCLMPAVLQRIIPRSNPQYSLPVQNQDKLIFGLCLVLSNSITLFGYALLSVVAYKGKFSFLEQSRVNKNTPWPWEKSPEQWSEHFWKMLKSLLMINFFWSPLTAFFVVLTTPMNFNMDTSQPPSFEQNLCQILLFMIIEDIYNTFSHAAFHSKYLYPLHKIHHENNTTFSLATEYAHPIEFIFGNSTASAVGFLLLSLLQPQGSVHIITVCMWISFRITLTCDVHSGYEWPWNFMKLFPFTAKAHYHDFHHSHNVGNYSSSFMILDALMGTNWQYYEYYYPKSKVSKKDQSE